MRTEGRRTSGNIEDRRGMSTGKMAVGGGIGAIAIAVIILLLAVFWWSGEKSQTAPSVEEYKDFDSKFKIFIAGISALIMGVYWKKIFTRNSFYMPFPGSPISIPKVISPEFIIPKISEDTGITARMKF